MDSDLQIGLIALGVAAVVGIVAYNKWQERKHRKSAEDAFRGDHPDVLLEKAPKSRIEPSFDGEEPAEPVIGDEMDEMMADDDSIAPAASHQPSGRHTTPGIPSVLDPRVDCVICIESIEPLDAPRLWAAQREPLQELSKPVRWFAFDDADNLWHELSAHSAGAYHWFCAAMQMVDRRGPIDENDFRGFTDGIQRVADQFLAVPADFPLRSAALANAADMDKFCASVDVQVGINLIADGEPFPGARLRALAESCGLRMADDGSFHAIDAEGRTLFTLSNHEAELFDADGMGDIVTRGVTFVVDVPLVVDGADVFEDMMRIAEAMSESLGGRIVDDNRAAFGNEAAAVIRTQIDRLQAEMADQGIPAGGSLAARLFSA